ncbi:MAG: hypothetical protein WC879_03555 [Melioribacteraceae bacterium]
MKELLTIIIGYIFAVGIAVWMIFPMRKAIKEDWQDFKNWRSNKWKHRKNV